MNSLDLKRVLRNLRSNKLYSLITIFGLSVGMAATILLFIYTQHELSYDQFHKDVNRIYRINSIFIEDTRSVYSICLRLNDSTLHKQVPEIEEIFQLYRYGEVEFINDNVRFKKIPFIFCDSNIHRVLTLKYLQGNPDDALQNPNSLVLTQSTAMKIFGSIDVIGKTLFESKVLYTITGIIEDYPKTSHFRFGAITPLKSSEIVNRYGGLEYETFIKFKENVNLNDGISKSEKGYSDIISKRFKEMGYRTDCFLQKLTDIQLKSDFQSRNGFDAPLKKIYIFFSMALIVLMIAIINFINLLTAQYEGKSKEIGIQKAIGASRKDIVIHFLSKSIAFSFIALIVAIIMVEFLIPSFGSILNCDLIITYRHNLILIIGLPLLALLVGLISGAYPAFFISKYPPYLAIKGAVIDKRGANKFTRALIIMQFSIAIFLIASLIVVNRQINFMKNADLGFGSHGVVAISNLNEKLIKSYLPIKDALKKLPEIKLISGAHHLMGGGVSGQGIEVVGEIPAKKYSINEYRVLQGYFETLDLRFLLGRSFDENIQSDRKSIIVNEAAVKTFGLKDPLNIEVILHETKMKIIGVVKDFHYASLEESIEPIMFTYYSSHLNLLMVKIEGGNLQSNLQNIETVLKEFDSGYILEYYILDDFYASKYKNYEQTEVLSSYASVLSLILALLGLYALSMFMVQKRTKEIGIRKVNGASRWQIIRILLKSYARQVIIAFVFATPIAYYVLSSWLNNFAYKIEINAIPFLMAGFLVLIVAILTVLGQSWSVASKNPVESLRCD